MRKTIVLLGCIFLIGAFSLRIYSFAQENQNEEVTSFSEELDIQSDLVQNLYKMMNPSEDASILIGLYENDTLANSYILATGAMKYIRENISLDEPMIQNKMFVATISQKDLQESIYEIFGTIDYSDEDFYVLNSEYGVCGFTYNDATSRYVSLNGCGGSMFERFDRKLVSAKMENDQVFLFEKSIYIYNDWNEYISRQFVYSDYNQSKMIDYIESDATNVTSVSVDDYEDKASVYVYVFDKINDEYIFNEMKKME